MSNKTHISDEAYLQLSDIEKAGYREKWEIKFPYASQPFREVSVKVYNRFSTYDKYKLWADNYNSLYEPKDQIKIRRIYIPIEPETVKEESNLDRIKREISCGIGCDCEAGCQLGIEISATATTLKEAEGESAEDVLIKIDKICSDYDPSCYGFFLTDENLKSTLISILSEYTNLKLSTYANAVKAVIEKRIEFLNTLVNYDESIEDLEYVLTEINKLPNETGNSVKSIIEKKRDAWASMLSNLDNEASKEFVKGRIQMCDDLLIAL